MAVATSNNSLACHFAPQIARQARSVYIDLDHAVGIDLAGEIIRCLVGRRTFGVAGADIKASAVAGAFDAAVLYVTAVELGVVVGTAILEGVELAIQVKHQ